MVPFYVGQDIKNIKLLFGRDSQIKELTGYALRRENVGIIGARRFGKTCLMKSMQTYINSHPEFNAYTLFFDPKTHGGIKKDTDAVYRKMTSMLVAQMCKDKIVKEGIFNVARRCDLDISSDRIDLEEQIQNWSSERQRDVLFTFVDLLSSRGKYLLLLIDEIDYLLLEAFEEPSDFSRIRGYSSNARALKFWMAGTAPWSTICTQIGSPELNGGVHSVPLYPLQKDEFSRMWNFECNLIQDDREKQKMNQYLEFVFEKSGGVPFYAKFMGAHLLSLQDNQQLPSYLLLRDYLSEVVNNRFHTESEKKVLFLLSKGPIENGQTIPDGITGLVQKGLVTQNSNVYKISIGYLKEYILAIEEDKNLLTQSLEDCNTSNIERNYEIQSTNMPNSLVDEQDKLNTLVIEISRLRDNINKIWKDNELWRNQRSDGKYYPPFVASTEDFSEFRNLMYVCDNESLYGAFAASLYKLYYEGSNKGWNLPIGYVAVARNTTSTLSRNIHPNETESQFAKMVLANRHMFGHRDFHPTASQISTEQLLSIINDGQRPVTRQHFMNMQFSMLQACRDELVKMTTYLNSLH